MAMLPKRDFLAELHKICNEKKSDPSENYKNNRINKQLYNIHKRSLPVGIDKVVMLNVTKEEAEKIIEHYLKTKLIYAPEDPHDDNKKTIIYYDIVATNASPRERSIFYNKKPLVLNEKVY